MEVKEASLDTSSRISTHAFRMSLMKFSAIEISSATIKIREWKSGYSLLPPRIPQLTHDKANDKQIDIITDQVKNLGFELFF